MSTCPRCGVENPSFASEQSLRRITFCYHCGVSFAFHGTRQQTKPRSRGGVAQHTCAAGSEKGRKEMVACGSSQSNGDVEPSHAGSVPNDVAFDCLKEAIVRSVAVGDRATDSLDTGTSKAELFEQVADLRLSEPVSWREVCSFAVALAGELRGRGNSDTPDAREHVLSPAGIVPGARISTATTDVERSDGGIRCAGGSATASATVTLTRGEDNRSSHAHSSGCPTLFAATQSIHADSGDTSCRSVGHTAARERVSLRLDPQTESSSSIRSRVSHGALPTSNASDGDGDMGQRMAYQTLQQVLLGQL